MGYSCELTNKQIKFCLKNTHCTQNCISEEKFDKYLEKK